MPDQDLSRYGLVGSPTSVERMFAPPEGEKQVYLEGSAKEKAEELFSILTGKKII
ncbi:electron transfer flavoprotein beta subunit [Blautia sp. CAG:52]|nr:electron transfer flavoprotein beta subunit [Blautia sp. CAG:52]